MKIIVILIILSIFLISCTSSSNTEVIFEELSEDELNNINISEIYEERDNFLDKKVTIIGNVSFFHEGHDRNGGWGSSLVLIEGDHMLYLPGSYGTYSTGTASYSNNVINGVEIIGNKEYLFEGTIIPKEYNLRYLYLNVTKIRELN